jgi:hypothetical protein
LLAHADPASKRGVPEAKAPSWQEMLWHILCFTFARQSLLHPPPACLGAAATEEEGWREGAACVAFDTMRRHFPA